MPLENLVAFVAASFLIALSPGPGTAMALRQSVHGRKAALATVFGMEVGVFAISFLPQFVPAGEAGQGVLLFLAMGWVLIDTVWYLIIVSILHTIRGWLGRPRVRPALEKLSGGVLLALGIRLVLDPR